MKKITVLIIIFDIIIIGLFYNNLFNTYKKLDVIIEKHDNSDVEEYIIGVVSCEMPASFEIEALKSQAVAARTYYYNELANNPEKKMSNSDQCYLTNDELKEKWGNEYDKYNNKIREAVYLTKNKVMKKDNKLFKAYYFSTSNGVTESSKTVFNLDITDSVDSSWDKLTNNYEVKTTFTKNQLSNILGSFNKIIITKISDTSHVEEVMVDNTAYTGIEFRKKLNLRSTDFSIENIDNNYIITTHGYGHGVGMSQYGANYLAQNNKNYEEILEYYYQNIKIEEI